MAEKLRARIATVASLSVVCCGIVGCSSFGSTSLFGKGDDLASIDDVKGPTERRLQTVAFEEAAVVASRDSDPALIEAKRLFDAGEYKQATKAYELILERYRPDNVKRAFGNPRSFLRGKSADERAIDEYGSPVEQECLFMLAECEFASGDLPKAEEGYQRLLRRYPSTRHLDAVTRRIYTISRHWLGFPPAQISGGPGYEQNGDIEQVVFTDVQQSIDPTLAPKKSGWLNLTDQTRPTFDTTGRALNSLKSIWLNDPTGPLADDALILTANHYYRSGDPVEAGRYYELLREQYPDSPHLKNAYLLESHVKLTSYVGDEYDDKALDEAATLKQASLQIFPDLTTEQKEVLTQELAQIEDAKIAREWALVEFYRQKGRPEAVRLYCNSILNEHPESRYADLAQEMLQILAEEQRGGGQSRWPFGRRAPQPAAPTLNPVAIAPPNLTRPSPTTPIGQEARGLAAQPLPAPRNFASIFDEAEAAPTARALPQQQPRQVATQSTANPFAGSESPIRQVSATADGANPFAQFMTDEAPQTRTAQKPVVTAAHVQAEQPSQRAEWVSDGPSAGVWQPNPDSAEDFQTPRGQ